MDLDPGGRTLPSRTFRTSHRSLPQPSKSRPPLLPVDTPFDTPATWQPLQTCPQALPRPHTVGTRGPRAGDQRVSDSWTSPRPGCGGSQSATRKAGAKDDAFDPPDQPRRRVPLPHGLGSRSATGRPSTPTPWPATTPRRGPRRASSSAPAWPTWTTDRRREVVGGDRGAPRQHARCLRRPDHRRAARQHATYRHTAGPGGRLRPHLQPVEVRLGGVGAGRRGDQGRSSTTATAGPSTTCSPTPKREVFHSRSGPAGIVEEDIDGVVAAASPTGTAGPATPSSTTTWWSGTGPRACSDGRWRTLDSRGLFKSVDHARRDAPGCPVRPSDRCAGRRLGRPRRRHSTRPATRSPACPKRSWREFSQRAEQIDGYKDRLRADFVAAHGRADGRRDHAAPPAGHPRHPARQDAPQPGRDDRGLARAGRRLRR